MCGGQARHVLGDDLLLELGGGVVDVEEEAASTQGFGQLARRIGGQHHERALGRRDRPQLGHGHLEVTEDLEQQTLDLDVRLVEFVDEEHHGLGGADRLQQRSCQQEFLGEDVVPQRIPFATVIAGALRRGDPEQLLGVVPLIERTGLVDTLITLEPDQPSTRRASHRLGQLGLADTSRAFDE